METWQNGEKITEIWHNGVSVSEVWKGGVKVFENIPYPTIPTILKMPLISDISDVNSEGQSNSIVNYNVTFGSEGAIFNGLNTYLASPGNLLNINYGSISFGAEIKINGLASGALGILGKNRASAAGGRYGGFVNTSNLTFITHIAAAHSLTNAISSINDSSFHKLVFVYDRVNNLKKIYIDGILVKSEAVGANSGNLVQSGYFFIGCYGDANGTAPLASNYFNGIIRKAFVSRHVFSDTDSIEIFNQF